MEKDKPQPQDDVALGFLIEKDSPIISFLKSTIEPEIISKDALSIITLLNTISSSFLFLSKPKLYLKPEQPPP